MKLKIGGHSYPLYSKIRRMRIWDSEMEFFEKAEENLHAAKLLFDSGYYNACANRAYYAGLHAALAALESKGFKRDRIDHGLVQADFAQKLVRRQKFYPGKFRSYLSDMQSVRDQADYSVRKISKKLACIQIAQSEQLVEIIRKDLIK